MAEINRKETPLKKEELNIMDDLGVGCSLTFFFGYSIPVFTQERMARNFIYRRKQQKGNVYRIEVNRDFNYLKIHKDK